MKKIISAILFILVILTVSGCGNYNKDIKVYNKEMILKEYGSDIDSALFVFPDDTKMFMESTFVSSLQSGLFDTDGYIIMNVKYDKEDYKREVERLSNVKCMVQNTEMKVLYDVKSYALPAYVAVDGFDYVYEYALVDDDNCEIIYVLLSYPEDIDLSKYQEYLKLNMSEYEIEDVLNRFSIYVRENEEGVYVEYSDEDLLN